MHGLEYLLKAGHIVQKAIQYRLNKARIVTELLQDERHLHCYLDDCQHACRNR